MMHRTDVLAGLKKMSKSLSKHVDFPSNQCQLVNVNVVSPMSVGYGLAITS